MANCILAGNACTLEGGSAIGSYGEALSLANCTVENNSAVFRVGAIFNNEPGATIVNSILWGNRSRGFPIDGMSASMTFSHCVVENSGGSADWSEASTLKIPIEDVRGGIRPVDGDSDGEAQIDIGAFEYLSELDDSDRDSFSDAPETSVTGNPLELPFPTLEPQLVRDELGRAFQSVSYDADARLVPLFDFITERNSDLNQPWSRIEFEKMSATETDGKIKVNLRSPSPPAEQSEQSDFLRIRLIQKGAE
ncbi:MAG: hypothetical protein ACI9R3_000308 [Verrucomicrobiales bacterium]|jgi:hypothetical protein